MGYLHASSAIDTQNLSVYPFTILAGQKCSHASHINGHSHAVQRAPRRRVLVNLLVGKVLAVWNVLFADSLVHVGFDATGRNGVDGDFLVTTVDGHASDEGLDGTLASGVDSVLGDTLGLTCNGAHQDDAATNLEVFVGFSCDKELSTSVDVEDSVVFLFCDIFQVTKGHDAGVGDDNIDFAEMGFGLLHQSDSFLDVGDISLDGNGIGAIANCLDRCHDFVCTLAAVSVVDDHLCPTTSQFLCSFGTHSTP